jgi:hypothetical protein
MKVIIFIIRTINLFNPYFLIKKIRMQNGSYISCLKFNVLRFGVSFIQLHGYSYDTLMYPVWNNLF